MKHALSGLSGLSGNGSFTSVFAIAMLAAVGGLAPASAMGEIITTAHWTQAVVAGNWHLNGPNNAEGRGVVDSGEQLFGPATSQYSPADTGQFGVLSGDPPRGHNVYTSADASLSATATPGRLSAHMGGSMVMNFDPGVGELPAGVSYNNYSATALASFREVVIYTTTNPLGSDIKLEVGLESTVSTDGAFFTGILSEGAYNAYAGASMTIRRDGFDPVTLATVDSVGYDASVDGVQKEHIMYQAMMLHVDYNAPLVLAMDGALGVGGGGYNASAIFAADASHTALFAISSADPLASYTSASGTVYPTSVPEPTATASVLATAMAISLKRRGRRM